MEEPKYAGIEISKLKAGDVITADSLQELHGENTEPGVESQFWSFVLKLKSDILNYHFKNGTPVAVTQKRGDLHIIQSNEMSEYCVAVHDSSLRRMAKYNVLMNYVDTSEMTADDIRKHERRSYVMSEQMGAVLKARSRLGLTSGVMLSNAQIVRSNDDLPSV